jgi:acyl-CoA reductase-like NAD-dependent aldehyde dehydrogenase
MKPKVEALTTGNQLDEKSKVGPMVKESEAARVDEWINEAVANGARLVAGGGRRGAIYTPAVVADVKPNMRISRDELFGPAVAVTPFEGIDEAISLANDSVYGLAAGIFTENCGMGDEICARSRGRQPARQLGISVAESI